MDRRDEVSRYGTFLESLPDVEVDTEQMTATFYLDPEEPEPTPPSPSMLEQMGQRIDEALAKGVSKIVDKLHERDLLTRSDYHRDFPAFKAKAGYWELYPNGLRGAVERVKKEGFYSVARLSVDVHKKWQQNHNVQLTLRFGGAMPHRLQQNELWASFSARPAEGKAYGTVRASWWDVLPFQVGIGKSPIPRY